MAVGTDVMLNLLSSTTGPSSVRTWRALLVFLLVVVTYLALTPKPLQGFESGLDKVAHLLAFTALAFSGYLGFPASRGTRTALPFGLLAYGGLIEVLQLFVPGRTSEWGDLLADGIGIVFGIGLAALMLHSCRATGPLLGPMEHPVEHSCQDN
jgi:VanZ family protein